MYEEYEKINFKNMHDDVDVWELMDWYCGDAERNIRKLEWDGVWEKSLLFSRRIDLGHTMAKLNVKAEILVVGVHLKLFALSQGNQFDLVF